MPINNKIQERNAEIEEILDNWDLGRGAFLMEKEKKKEQLLRSGFDVFHRVNLMMLS